MRPLPLSLLPILAAPLSAQILPSPVVEPKTAPRAHWVATPGVTGTPATRTSNPGVASATKMYVFGGRLGNNTSTVLNDLYEFDGATWTQLNANGAAGAPPRRGRACIAWNEATNKLVVFSGEGTGSFPANLLGDTWEWDPQTNTWTDLTATAGSAPPARRWGSMTYDPVTSGILLFGGRDANNAALNDTWLFIGGIWVPIPTATVPPARWQHTIVTRPDFGDVVLVGGQDTTTSPTTRHFDVWKFDGLVSNWVQIMPTTPAVPASSYANQAVYDPIRQVIVLEGGNGNTAYGGGHYGTEYGGTPTGWCSEFDCVTNEWRLYGGATFGTNDPVIGRVSRYFGAFVPALGKVYKVSGQPTSNSGTFEYQATPVASSMAVGTGCNGMALVANNDPWSGRTFSYSVTGVPAGALVAAFIGFSTYPSPIPLAPVFPGCASLVVQEVVSFPLANVGGIATQSIPFAAEPSIVSLTPYFHALAVESSGPAITNISSPNALALTPGAM